MASSFLLEKAYIYDPKNPGEPPAMGGVAGVLTAPPPGPYGMLVKHQSLKHEYVWLLLSKKPA
jgi:hypothetical protein